MSPTTGCPPDQAAAVPPPEARAGCATRENHDRSAADLRQCAPPDFTASRSRHELAAASRNDVRSPPLVGALERKGLVELVAGVEFGGSIACEERFEGGVEQRGVP